MKTHSKICEVRTPGGTTVVDLTERILEAVAESGVKEGLLTVAVNGSTAGITTVEYEPGLVRDLQEAFERLLPSGASYHHNRGGEDNGHAHIRSALLGTSLTVPIVSGKPYLGTWQQVVLVDFDTRPRTRNVLIQALGS